MNFDKKIRYDVGCKCNEIVYRPLFDIICVQVGYRLRTLQSEDVRVQIGDVSQTIMNVLYEHKT